MEILKTVRDGGELPSKWPYTYHQRIVAHPDINGQLTNQLEIAIQMVADTPFTRRAVVTTAVPDVDPYLTEDNPCLREIIFRCMEDEDGSLVLNTSAFWRSRDLFKAWGDNMIGLTFWLQMIAQEISKKCDKPVRVGSYAEFNASLHIYGQDHSHVGGDENLGLKSIFDTFDEKTFVARSLTSDMAKDMLVVPQLMNLLSEDQMEQWKFPQSSIDLINNLIAKIGSGELIA